MSDLSIFTYRYRSDFIHQFDIRFKLISLILISLSIMNSDFKSLFLFSFLMICLMIHTRLSLISVFKSFRYFFILLIFVWIARSLSTPGTPLKTFEVFKTSKVFHLIIIITHEGLHDGLLICWRLLLITLLGLLLSSTSRSSEIRTAVSWFLRPVPFIPHKRAAVMISLMIRFIPVILNQAKEISDVQRARGIEYRKNPVYRLIKFSVPLLRRTFKQADNLITAMEARCYSEDRTELLLVSSKKDWAALFAVIFFSFSVMDKSIQFPPLINLNLSRIYVT